MDHRNGITVDVYSFPECSPITAAKQWKRNTDNRNDIPKAALKEDA